MTSFDLVDTHHARSMVCQIKYKLLHLRHKIPDNPDNPGLRHKIPDNP
jgi:hypothetical protein